MAGLYPEAVGRWLAGATMLADLRAVELTRNPGAMHAALRRLRDAHQVGPPLPSAYHSLYFTAEQALPDGYPAPQASIEARLAALERLDPGLRAARGARSVIRAVTAEVITAFGQGLGPVQQMAGQLQQRLAVLGPEPPGNHQEFAGH